MKGTPGLEQETGALRSEDSQNKRESGLGLWDQCMAYHHCPEQSTLKII